MNNIEIVDYNPKYDIPFKNLNIEWLDKYFYVEEYDKEVLSNPKSFIIDKGGYIFFAKYNDKIVGTVALINQKECFELSKMAVLPELRGLKIGQQLLDYCIQFSKNKGWKKIMLYSNRKLENAIYLYQKVGFKEVELEQDVHYNRADIKMVLTL